MNGETLNKPFRLEDGEAKIEMTKRQLEELDDLIRNAFDKRGLCVKQVLQPDTSDGRPIEVRIFFDGSVSLSHPNDAALYESLEGLKGRLSHG